MHASAPINNMTLSSQPPIPGMPRPDTPPGTGPIIPDPGPKPKPQRESGPAKDTERGNGSGPPEYGLPPSQ